jgi:hypothetical protein
LFGDDLLGLVGRDGFAGGVADDVGHAPVHEGPGTFGDAASHDAEGFEVARAAFGHLRVVDLRELGVLFAGVVGGADQGRAQQSGSGLGHGLALAVGVAGLRRAGR